MTALVMFSSVVEKKPGCDWKCTESHKLHIAHSSIDLVEPVELFNQTKFVKIYHGMMQIIHARKNLYIKYAGMIRVLRLEWTKWKKNRHRTGIKSHKHMGEKIIKFISIELTRAHKHTLRMIRIEKLNSRKKMHAAHIHFLRISIA